MKRIEAIRSDERIGYKSDSKIEEWFSDKELLSLLDEHEIETEKEAISWAYDFEGIKIEKEEEEYHFIEWEGLRMPLE